MDISLGWVIVYVEDPRAALSYYAETFGFELDFAGDDYGQLRTGSTMLGFASLSLGEKNFDGGVRPPAAAGPPANFELVLVDEDVDALYELALGAGCEPLAPPEDKPHGQRVGYVRDPFGTVLELATPL
jgi:uncharacterized glyoxalase superfamily protein PhnB